MQLLLQLNNEGSIAEVSELSLVLKPSCSTMVPPTGCQYV